MAVGVGVDYGVEEALCGFGRTKGAGIMEMADGIVINKADGDNVGPAQLAQAQYRSALHLFPPTTSGWMPEVLTYSGYYELGIAEVWEMIDRYFNFVQGNGYFEAKRQQQARWWMYETIDEQLRKHFYNNERIKTMLTDCEADVLANRRSSFAAAAQVLNSYFDENNI